MKIVTQETQTVELEGQELAETYGNLAAYTLARLCAYCEPTWWLGRNFWLSLFLTVRFSLMARITRRPLIRLCSLIGQIGETPHRLLHSIAVPGFEKGMPVVCEGYSSGLYFDLESVRALIDSFDNDWTSWLELGETATGYPREAVAQLLQMAYESLLWARQNQVSIIEADEVVGAFGYR